MSKPTNAQLISEVADLSALAADLEARLELARTEWKRMAAEINALRAAAKVAA